LFDLAHKRFCDAFFYPAFALTGSLTPEYVDQALPFPCISDFFSTASRIGFSWSDALHGCSALVFRFLFFKF